MRHKAGVGVLYGAWQVSPSRLWSEEIFKMLIARGDEALHTVMGNNCWRLVAWSLESLSILSSPWSWAPFPLWQFLCTKQVGAHCFGERKIQTEGPQKHYPSATWAGLLYISTELNDQQEGCLCLAYVCCVTKLRWNLACNPWGLTNPVMNWDSLIGDVFTNSQTVLFQEDIF